MVFLVNLMIISYWFVISICLLTILTLKILWIVSLQHTLSQCPSWINPENFAGKNVACKTTTHWKSFHFPPHQCTFNLVHPVGNVEWLIFPGHFLNLTRISFYINSDSPWCLIQSHQDHNNPWWLFSQNINFIFLVFIDLFLFGCTNSLRWTENRYEGFLMR